jgi:hypothetical protein
MVVEKQQEVKPENFTILTTCRCHSTNTSVDEIETVCWLEYNKNIPTYRKTASARSS